MKIINALVGLPLLLILSMGAESPYPIDGYAYSGIRRLLRLEKVVAGTVKDTKPPSGALLRSDQIHLNLMNPRGDSLASFPTRDAKLQQKLSAVFPNLDKSYSLVLLEITPGKPVRFADHNSSTASMPGSVAKLAVAAGLFTELQRLYPDSYERRINLLKTRIVRADNWCITNVHTVPFYNPETEEFFKRVVQPQDEFSLFEWADHMLSVSSNAAASIVWKELVLMRSFGKEYPVSADREKKFWTETPKETLRTLCMEVVNTPMAKIGIDKEDFWLGNLFTSQGQKMLPGEGGSKASTKGLMQYLVALERGKVVDAKSSLEIKKLLYITDRRIRYASSPALSDAALFFKSGSLYKCQPEEGFECKKYMGNVYNYMNSIAIVEHPDGPVYMVALMSNVLRKNSANDHLALASRIDKLVRE